MNVQEYISNQVIKAKNIRIERFASKYKDYYNTILEMERDLDETHGMEFRQIPIQQMYFDSYYIFLMDNICIGYCILRYRNKVCNISSYAIVKEFRGKGYGKLCLKLLLDFIKNKLKYREVHLAVQLWNTNARKLYYSVGFKLLVTILEGKSTFIKTDKIRYITTDLDTKEDIDIYNQLKEIYKKYYKYPESYMFFKNGIIVKIINNKVVAGCGTNVTQLVDGNYEILFYPAAINSNYLTMFLKDAITSTIYYKTIGYNINNSIDCKYYSIINKFGKPKSEQLMLTF